MSATSERGEGVPPRDEALPCGPQEDRAASEARTGDGSCEARAEETED